MGYTVELSFDLRKKGDLTETKLVFEDEANKHGCEHFYYNYEISGYNRTLKRSHSIMTLSLKKMIRKLPNLLNFAKNKDI